MCGIVGIAGQNPKLQELKSMLTLINHRGPDGEGFYLSSDVGFGHVRLAIVDPSAAGAQPMQSPDKRYTLVYNGEIYNHMDFRSELEARGVCFRGHSDTETLLWLLILYSETILPKLNGIFAFAFYDSYNNSLLLGRDHMGVKPLYYTRTKTKRLLFASEIKSLFSTGEIEPRVNVDDILELFMFHFIAGEHTTFANIYELLPGHFMKYSAGKTEITKFWDPIPVSECELTTDSTSEKIRQMLKTAVKSQLMSDVPLGIMSSGGLDSAIVTAFSGDNDTSMLGFCFRDPNNGYDEFKYAQKISKKYGVELIDVRIDDNDVPDLLQKLIWHYDEPLPRPHHLASYAVAKQAQAMGLKVLLSGEGGDELFGGYLRYIHFTKVMNDSGDTSPLVFAHNRVAKPYIARFLAKQNFLNNYRLKCAEETTGLDLINRQLIVDQKTFLQHFLQRSDRMGMAAGIEMRVPLLDISLVEYINSLPGSEKISDYETKVCLRNAAKNLLPLSLVMRPKQPFDMPMAPLLQRGPVADFLDDMLLSNPRCSDLVDAQAIKKLVYDLRTGHDELWKVTWLLLTTEVWMRKFKVIA